MGCHPLDRLQRFRKLVLKNQAQGVVRSDLDRPRQAAVAGGPGEGNVANVKQNLPRIYEGSELLNFSIFSQ